MRKRSGRSPRAGEAAVPCGEVHDVGHGAAVGAGFREGFREVEREGLAQRFDQHADRAAAGEADGEGLVVADAVGEEAGLAVLQRLGRLDDDRAFDAAARDGARHLSVPRHGELAAHGARGRAPGLHHGGERRAAPGAVPGERLFECRFGHGLALLRVDWRQQSRRLRGIVP